MISVDSSENSSGMVWWNSSDCKTIASLNVYFAWNMLFVVSVLLYIYVHIYM